MEQIIQLTEEKLIGLDWHINYHREKLEEYKEQKSKLALELATLKVKLGTPTPGHEHNSFPAEIENN